jgi:threonine synthase
VYEQLQRIPEVIFVPLGNGTLFIGIIKALEEFLRDGIIRHMPQIYAVQSENCAPFARAFAAGDRHIPPVQPSPTLAEGIAIGIPMRGDEILHYVYNHGVIVITAPENRILEARERLAAQGIYGEHTSAATYAAYLALCDARGELRDPLIPMCGAGLKSDH